MGSRSCGAHRQVIRQLSTSPNFFSDSLRIRLRTREGQADRSSGSVLRKRTPGACRSPKVHSSRIRAYRLHSRSPRRYRHVSRGSLVRKRERFVCIVRSGPGIGARCGDLGGGDRRSSEIVLRKSKAGERIAFWLRFGVVVAGTAKTSASGFNPGTTSAHFARAV